MKEPVGCIIRIKSIRVEWGRRQFGHPPSNSLLRVPLPRVLIATKIHSNFAPNVIFRRSYCITCMEETDLKLVIVNSQHLKTTSSLSNVPSNWRSGNSQSPDVRPCRDAKLDCWTSGQWNLVFALDGFQMFSCFGKINKMDGRSKQCSNHLLVFQMGSWSGRPSASQGKSPRGRSPDDRLTERQRAVGTELDHASDSRINSISLMW